MAVPADTPDTMPEEPTVAIAVLNDDQIPPVVASERGIVLPTQTNEPPVIVPAEGEEFTVTALAAVAVPHVLITMYSIVSVPAVMPVAIPIPDKLALPFVELHKPPGLASV